MAVALTGTPVQINSSANSGSQSITVPGDATGVVVCVGGWQNIAGTFSDGTLTLGGTAFLESAMNDAGTNAHQSGIFFLPNPATGSQTLAWDWSGTGSMVDGTILYVLFVTGSDEGGTPIRDFYVQQSGGSSSWSTDTLTANADDMIVAFSEVFDNGTMTFSWTGATKLADLTETLSTAGSIATKVATGNQTVSVTTPHTDGGISAIVIKAATVVLPDPLTYLTGFEHGQVSASGAGLFPAAAGASTTIVATAPRTGTRHLRLLIPDTISTGHGPEYTSTFLGVTNEITFGVAFRFATMPGSGSNTIVRINPTTTGEILIRVDADGRLRIVDPDTPANPITGFLSDAGVIVANTWYWLDVKFVANVSPHTFEIKLNGQTPAGWSASAGTVPGTSGAIDALTLGDRSRTFDSTMDVYYDDLVVSGTASHFPLGEHEVEWIAPGRDGTHNAGTTVFIDGDTKTTPNFTNATTNAYSFVTKTIPWLTARSTTNNISAEVHSAGAYIEVKPATTAARTGETAAGVRAYGSRSSPATQANSAALMVAHSDGTAFPLYGTIGGAGADFSDTTNFFYGKTVQTPASGWTEAQIEGFSWRFGLPSGAGDVSPRPTAQAFGMEVAYPAATLPPIDGDAGTITSTFTISHTSSVIEKVGSASVSSTFAISATAERTANAAATLAFSMPITMGATTRDHNSNSATLTTAFSISAAAVKERLGSATLTFAMAVAASGIVDAPPIDGAASITMSFAISATGVKERTGAATITSTFAISAASVREKVGAATSTFAFSISATAQRERVGAATVTASFSTAAAGTVGHNSNSVNPITFAMAVAAAAVREKVGSSTLTFSMPITLGATTTDHRFNSATITFATSIYADGQIAGEAINGQATLTFAFGIAAAGHRTANAAATVTTSFTIAAAARRERLAAATLGVTFGIAASSIREKVGAVTIPVLFATAASGSRTTHGAASIPVAFSIEAAAIMELLGSATLTFSTTLSADGVVSDGTIDGAATVSFTFGLAAAAQVQHRNAVSQTLLYWSPLYGILTGTGARRQHAPKAEMGAQRPKNPLDQGNRGASGRARGVLDQGADEDPRKIA